MVSILSLYLDANFAILKSNTWSFALTRGIRKINMNDKTNIRFVNTHSKCICCDYYPDLAVHPFLLFPVPHRMNKTGVIIIARNRVFLKVISKILRFFPASDINYSASHHLPDKSQDVLLFIFR